MLSGEAYCVWSVWFAAHFRYDAISRPFDRAAWSADHAVLVGRRGDELRAAGWTVTVEDQNAFRLEGASAVLAGKPDIIAERGDEILVSDCKTGRQRASDYQQVLIYLFALPKVRRGLPAVARGEVVYLDHHLSIEPEELTAERREAIVALVRRLGSAERPERAPSARECAWCDIGGNDCPDRIETDVPIVQTVEF